MNYLTVFETEPKEIIKINFKSFIEENFKQKLGMNLTKYCMKNDASLKTSS